MKKKDAMIACPNCEGNGYEQVYWEAEEVFLECKHALPQVKLIKTNGTPKRGKKGYPAIPHTITGHCLIPPCSKNIEYKPNND